MAYSPGVMRGAWQMRGYGFPLHWRKAKRHNRKGKKTASISLQLWQADYAEYEARILSSSIPRAMSRPVTDPKL